MKLIFCPYCGDLFQLRLHKVPRFCACGKVKGRYINKNLAEVSKDAISVAVGNGSFNRAITEAADLQIRSHNTANRKAYQKLGCGRIEYAWVRPNDGPGNPHTKIIE